MVKNLPASAGDSRDAGSIPGSGRSPGGGLGHPLQYSCLENPIDRGAWQAIVHGVAKSQKRLRVCVGTHNAMIPFILPPFEQCFLCVCSHRFLQPSSLNSVCIFFILSFSIAGKGTTSLSDMNVIAKAGKKKYHHGRVHKQQHNSPSRSFLERKEADLLYSRCSFALFF